MTSRYMPIEFNNRKAKVRRLLDPPSNAGPSRDYKLCAFIICLLPLKQNIPSCGIHRFQTYLAECDNCLWVAPKCHYAFHRNTLRNLAGSFTRQLWSRENHRPYSLGSSDRCCLCLAFYDSRWCFFIMTLTQASDPFYTLPRVVHFTCWLSLMMELIFLGPGTIVKRVSMGAIMLELIFVCNCIVNGFILESNLQH